jgi:hypothetical protein
MSARKGDKLFFEGIRSLKSGNFKLAEKKFKETVIKKIAKYEKAKLIYQALLIRKECERLIQELKFRF